MTNTNWEERNIVSIFFEKHSRFEPKRERRVLIFDAVRRCYHSRWKERKKNESKENRIRDKFPVSLVNWPDIERRFSPVYNANLDPIEDNPKQPRCPFLPFPPQRVPFHRSNAFFSFPFRTLVRQITPRNSPRYRVPLRRWLSTPNPR